MEQNLHTPEVYDFRRYDHLWQRVAPGLEPYPAPGQDASARGNPQTPAFDETEAAVPVAAQTNSTSALTPAQQDSQLPGAAPDPCCMGSAAAGIVFTSLDTNTIPGSALPPNFPVSVFRL